VAKTKGLGARKHARTNFDRPGFLILEPNGAWIECFITDVSEGGAGLNVGSLALPKTFLLLLSTNGHVRRLCKLAWRNGELAGVQFITTKEMLDPNT
jgi:hypothetical protein